MQELQITHGQSDKILPPGRDAIRTEERQTPAGMNDALNAQSQCDIERVADIATQLLSIKESINKEHKQRFESLLRMLCRDFSERLSVLHRFLVMMTKPDSADRDDFAFNFHRFRSIVSQSLSSDQRIAEVQRIATTEIGQWNAPGRIRVIAHNTKLYRNTYDLNCPGSSCPSGY